jgi:MFS family permease
MFWRFFQTFGAAPGISVGAGVVGDIYRLEERGTAMGIFLAVSVIVIRDGTDFINSVCHMTGHLARADIGAPCGRYARIFQIEQFFTHINVGLAAYYASWRIMQLALAMGGSLALGTMYRFFPETSHPNSLGVDKAKFLETKPGRNFKFINPVRSLWLLRSPLLMTVVCF